MVVNLFGEKQGNGSEDPLFGEKQGNCLERSKVVKTKVMVVVWREARQR